MRKNLLSVIFIILIPTNLFASNIRFGPFLHNLDYFNQKHEKGFNLATEYLVSEKYSFIFGRPLVGLSLNILGYSSNIYTGLLWQLKIIERATIELGFGASLNNSELKNRSKSKQATGSNILFRESIGINYRYLPELAIILQLEHRSNANIRRPNPGFTNLGVMFELTI